MALISVNISKQHASFFEVQGPSSDAELLQITSQVYLEPVCDIPCFYSRDTISFHGTVEDLRELAEKILAAIPAKAVLAAARGETEATNG